ncbi:MAG: hypothetical protein H7X80_01515 [bacterium]|nr:hypothetical protein [Candidatus Kapabacteria bacterium]
MKHDVLRHSEFFTHMEEFGYLRGLEEYLPRGFTAVFEIARVLEDPTSDLFRALRPMMTVSPARINLQTDSREWRPNRNVSVGEEYEAALIRSISDIRRLQSHQFLLPDDVFLRRLAQRSLWINVPRTPITRGFGSSATEYAPDNFKQKVYLLLDTSTSMSSHHRIQMAKAVAYVFLKRNLRELGHIYFRTFDVDIGPLHVATDARSLRELIQAAMRVSRLGNGTAMERAILQASDDIRAQAALSGAELLVITDGACHIDLERIRNSLGDTIRINTVKIGNAQIYAEDRELHEIATAGTSPQHIELVKLEEGMRRAEYDLRAANTDADRSRLQSEVGSIKRRLEQVQTSLFERMRLTYGREIETLSKVFINIDDITSDAIFVLRDSEIAEMRELVREVELDFEEGLDADDLREAAVLYEHVQLLLELAPEGSEQHKQLTELSSRLQDLLKDVLDSEGSSSSRGSALRGIARSDMRDLSLMLHTGSGRGGSIIAAFLSMIRRTMRILFPARKR